MDRNDVAHIFDESVNYRYIGDDYAFHPRDFIAKRYKDCNEKLMEKFLDGLKKRCYKSGLYYCINEEELCEYFDEVDEVLRMGKNIVDGFLEGVGEK